MAIGRRDFLKRVSGLVAAMGVGAIGNFASGKGGTFHDGKQKSRLFWKTPPVILKNIRMSWY